MKTTERNCNHSTCKNPLLMPEILSEIFSYFEQDDSKTLRTCREVCTAWNNAASRLMKRSIRWTINLSSLSPPSPTSIGRDNCACGNGTMQLPVPEVEFTKLLSTSRNNVFKNFKLKIQTGPISRVRTLHTQEIIRNFMHTVGLSIVDLSLHGFKIDHINIILSNSNLPNLETLLVHLPEKFECSYHEVVFPKLKAITFEAAPERFLTIRQDQLSEIYCSVLENSPQLTSFAITELSTVHDVLGCDNLANLTTLKLFQSPRIGPGTLKGEHLRIIMEKCPNVQSFTGSVRQFHDYPDIMTFVGRYASQLLELELHNTDRSVKENSDEEAKIVRQQPWPPYGLLQSLSLHSWELANNYNFIMPSLRSLQVEGVSECGLPLLAPKDSKLRRLEKVHKLNICLPHVEHVGPETIQLLGHLLPNLRDLEICTIDIDTLRSIFACMAGLKKLKVNPAKNFIISESAITGLTTEQLAELAGKPTTNKKTVDSMRGFSFIGDLEGLQYFYCKQVRRTRSSVLYGFSYLPQLKSINDREFVHRDYEALMQRVDFDSEFWEDDDHDDVSSQPNVPGGGGGGGGHVIPRSFWDNPDFNYY